MRLDVAVPNAFVFLQLPFCSIECVAQRYVDVFVIGRVRATDLDLLVRHDDVHVHLELAPVRLVLVRAVDRYAATQNRGAEALELMRQVARPLFNHWRRIEVPKGNLY